MDFTREYLALLRAYYGGLNLTSIVEPEEFYLKHYKDSLLPWEQVDVFRKKLLGAKKVVDVGTGGGFPLLPLAFNIRQREFSGLEARAKKVKAVSVIAKSMGITNVSICQGRLEEEIFDDGTLLLFRALGKVSDCLKKVRGRGKITCFFYKGPSYRAERELEGLPGGWQVFVTKKMNLSGTMGRVLLGLERAKDLPLARR